MRIIQLFLSVLFPALLFGQHTYTLSGFVPSNSQLIKLGSQTILIQPMDKNNQLHKWIALDSTLTPYSTKRLVTPDAGNIFSQSYVGSVNSIIRIDQFLIDGQIFISAFVFDAKGNLIRKQDIENNSATAIKSVVAPFYISQSPDKKIVSLVQVINVEGEKLSVSAIVLDESLSNLNMRHFNIPFNAEMFDLYLPVVNNNKGVFIPTAEKFNSYKISSAINGYLLSASDKEPRNIQFNLARKKIKNLNFQFSEERIMFTGLYSDAKDKDDVEGVIISGYDLVKNQPIQPQHYAISNEAKTALKKTYGMGGRRGNLLNYVSILPEVFSANSKHSYATLLPERQTTTRVKTTIPSTPSGADIAQINQQITRVNSLVGTQPPGYARPMNVAEASAYAAIYHSDPMAEKGEGYRPKSYSSNIAPPNNDKNLLFFNFKNADADHRFIKIKSNINREYQFFAYVPAESSLGTLYYVLPNFGKPYLKKSSIGNDGNLIEKKVFEDKSRIIIPHYPFITDGETIISFYEDKAQGKMGLIRLAL